MILILLQLIIYSFSSEMVFSSPNERKKIGLALSGGGAKGLAHIGVLKVLEENGIKIDYITGTSMGSIIGGLYAIGYTPESLERLVIEQDWNYLLSDSIPLRNISMEEKSDESRYIAVFPFRNNKIELPKGFVTGHNIQMLLSRLCWPVNHIQNFEDFPIPFHCVAADIETGEAVIMKSGYLPDAMRASMSIPSLLTPVERDGKMLIDGGVARNFPVSEVRDMGADIVIGVDVSENLHKHEDLNTLADVLLQTINYKAAADNEAQRTNCDILIRPDTSQYEIMGFDKAREIIDSGEKAARQIVESLKPLTSSSPPDTSNVIRRDLHDEVEPLFISDIDVIGLEHVSSTLVWSKLDIEPGKYIQRIDIEQGVERLFGSRYFDRVTYRIIPDVYGTRLVIDVTEKDMNDFGLGMRYGSDLKTALLANTAFRNLLFDGSKLSVSAVLGSSPTLEINYFIYIKQNPGLGISFDWKEGYLEAPRYENDKLLANYEYKYIMTECNVMNVNSSTISYRLGAHCRYAEFKHIVGLEYIGAPITAFSGVHGSMEINTYDRAVFPRRGMRFFAEAETATIMYSSKKTGILEDPCVKIYAELCRIDTLSRKLSLIRSYYFSHVRGDDIHPVFYVYLGGKNRRHTHLVPFDGINYLQAAGKSALATELGLRYEMSKNKYLTLRGSAGNVANELHDLLEDDTVFYSMSTTYSLNSFLGPLEYSLMWSTRPNVKYTHVNIGYVF